MSDQKKISTPIRMTNNNAPLIRHRMRSNLFMRSNESFDEVSGLGVFHQGKTTFKALRPIARRHKRALGQERR